MIHPVKAMSNWLVKRMSSNDVFASSMREYGMQMYSRYGQAPDVSQEALVRQYKGWVYTCATINAVAVASTPLKLYATRAKGQARARAKAVPISSSNYYRLCAKQNLHARLKSVEDVEEILEHPLLTLLSQVNPHDNGFETIELTSTMLDLTGCGYWFVERGPLGVPSQLWLLRSQWVKIIPDKKSFIKGYLYGVSPDKQIRLEPDEVIYFKYPNPRNPWYGAGPVEAAAYAIERQNQMDRYEASTLRNMGRPDLGIVYKGGTLDPERRKELEIEWNNAFRGSDKAGKIKVMDQDFTVEQFGWSPKEMEFLQGRPWTMKEIASAMNVPIGFLDTSEISKAPRAGMEGTELFLAKYATRPRCLRIEQKLNEKLCPMYDDRLFLAFDNPVPEDRRFDLLDEGQQLKNYSLTINEARAKRNLPPVAWGNIPIAPTSVAPLGGRSPTAEEQAPKSQPTLTGIGLASSDTERDGFPGGHSLHPDLEGVEVEVR